MSPSGSVGGHSTKKLAGVFLILVILALTVSMASLPKGSQDYHWSRGESTPPVREGSHSLLSSRQILDLLKAVHDPELGISIVDLGLVYDLKVDGRKVELDMTLTSPKCPLAGDLIEGVKQALFADTTIENVHLHLTFDPPWTIDRIAPEAREKILGISTAPGTGKATP